MSNAIKRPWSKPTVSLMHRIVRTYTGTNTQYVITENGNYTLFS